MAETCCIGSNVLLTVQAINNETVPVSASLFARTLQKFVTRRPVFANVVGTLGPGLP
jgi:hypothetical protein